ncbi:PrsW family glutamic-type intramembrane protease [Leptospira ilyithenensis]|uniref:PrsW family intramembrane metalloprotease n=1 Tax=Leptospira ilyithenensis TaxID=2484901 RepID=A0A4R9LL49_9LEPT|nr:PrsW family glutamic-type intramembrane protease [Leptospira ilyithenensis]TGN08335.1 PrsW family intramembrane metalloprotease [Leptospira ilyithenensis]
MASFLNFSSLIMFLINFATLVFYYSFYRFHFYRHSESFLHYTAIAFSIFSVGIALALQALVLAVNPYPGHEFKAIVLSGAVEEFSKLLGIYLFFRKNQDEFTVTDGIFYGLVLGGGFGLLENILYFIDSALWSQVLRSITSLPIHMINGGLIGAFLMIFLFSSNRIYRFIRLFIGIGFCMSIHALYNYSLFTDSGITSILPFCILILFFILEVTIAKSRILLPGSILKLMNMTVEDYEILSRHNRHEGWIQNVQKHILNENISLFQIPNIRVNLLTAFFLVPSIVSILVLIYHPELITRNFTDLEIKDYFALFVIYPAVIGIMFFFGGVLNPYFFRDRMLAVPLFGSVDLKSENDEENTSLFYIYLNQFYVPVSKMYPPNTRVLFDLWVGVTCYKNIKGRIIWTKENMEGNCGAMCELDAIEWKYLIHWNLVRSRQNFKNLFIRTKN